MGTDTTYVITWPKNLLPDIRERVQRAMEKSINPPVVAMPLPKRRLKLKAGTVPTENTAIDHTLLEPMGSLVPRQSDSTAGPFTKCRKVKGGFRATKRYIIWS